MKNFKSLENLPISTLATMVATAHSTFSATGLAGKLMLIMCLFSFGLFAQTPLVIPLSEMTLVVTPTKLGGSAMINGELLNPEKPIRTDSTQTNIWIAGETILTMEFDRNCKKCPASPIWYKQGDTVRVWVNSDDFKTWNELLPTLLSSNNKLLINKQ